MLFYSQLARWCDCQRTIVVGDEGAAESLSDRDHSRVAFG